MPSNSKRGNQNLNMPSYNNYGETQQEIGNFSTTQGVPFTMLPQHQFMPQNQFSAGAGNFATQGPGLYQQQPGFFNQNSQHGQLSQPYGMVNNQNLGFHNLQYQGQQNLNLINILQQQVNQLQNQQNSSQRRDIFPSKSMQNLHTNSNPNMVTLDLNQASISKRSLTHSYSWMKFLAQTGTATETLKSVDELPDFTVTRCLIKEHISMSNDMNAEQGNVEAELLKEKNKLSLYAVSKLNNLNLSSGKSLLKDILRLIEENYALGSRMTLSSVDSNLLDFKVNFSHNHGTKKMASNFNNVTGGSRGLCNAWNKGESCLYDPCWYLHYCRRCSASNKGHQKHPSYKCPNRSGEPNRN